MTKKQARENDKRLRGIMRRLAERRIVTKEYYEAYCKEVLNLYPI